MPLPSNTTLRLSAVLLSTCLALDSMSAKAADSIALVLGNSDYYNLPTLPACTTSMHQISEALDELGFRVVQRQDSTSGGIAAAMSQFQSALDGAPDSSAIAYFCGHAATMDSRLFVLPVSANLTRPSDVRTQGILAKSFLDLMVRGRTSRALVLMDLDPTEPLSKDALSTLDDKVMNDATGLLVAIGSLEGDKGSPLATALAEGLAAPNVQTASLLMGLQDRLNRDKGTNLGALRLPAQSLALVEEGEPAAPVVATPVPPTASEPPPQRVGKPPRHEARFPGETGMSAEQRRMVQIGLARFGYYGGRIDSVFGPETRKAIRQYQGEIGAVVTGVITGEQATRLLRIP
jgi:peptidoglycan hydrolase-like protein with peptidoglycan-binding domain